MLLLTDGNCHFFAYNKNNVLYLWTSQSSPASTTVLTMPNQVPLGAAYMMFKDGVWFGYSGSLASLVTPVVNSLVPVGLPSGVRSVVGQISYTVTGLQRGATATVTLLLPSNSGVSKVLKYTGGRYQDITSKAAGRAGTAKVDGDMLTVTVTDGGPGDEDGLANGIVVDPLVPVAPARASQTLTFKPAPSSTAMVGSSYKPSASSSAKLKATYSVAPLSVFVCSINAGTVTFTGPGICTVFADQAGSSKVEAASRIGQSVTVVSAATAVSASVNLSTISYGLEKAAQFSATVTSTGGLSVSSGTVTFSTGGTKLCSAKVTTGGLASCSISKANLLARGSYQVVASYVDSGKPPFASSTSSSVNLRVS